MSRAKFWTKKELVNGCPGWAARDRLTKPAGSSPEGQSGREMGRGAKRGMQLEEVKSASSTADP